MKTCSKCGKSQPVTSFYKNRRSPDGRRGDCKRCVLADRRARYESDGDLLKGRVVAYREAHPERVLATVQKRRASDPAGYRRRNRTAQLRRYGLTQDSYDALFASQGERCAICKSDDPGQYWSIDHDHVSGEVRGILCWHCNIALGHFRDDPVALIAAADYLMRHTVELVR